MPASAFGTYHIDTKGVRNEKTPPGEPDGVFPFIPFPPPGDGFEGSGQQAEAAHLSRTSNSQQLANQDVYSCKVNVCTEIDSSDHGCRSKLYSCTVVRRGKVEELVLTSVSVVLNCNDVRA